MFDLSVPNNLPNGTFEKFIQKINLTETCWIWTARTNSQTGYGELALQKQRRKWRPHAAHRLSWYFFRGTIPSGLVIRHKCHNRGCVNPEHLLIGTQKDNIHDSIDAGRMIGPPHPKGESHPRAKVSEKDVVDIRARRASGESINSIKKDFPQIKWGVEDICRRKSWRHLP